MTTWGQFKASMESSGVRDEDEIGYIDTCCIWDLDVSFKTTDERTEPPYFDWLTPEQAAAVVGPREVSIS